MVYRLFAALFLAFTLGQISAVQPALAGDEITQFSPDDPKMNAAIGEARKTLPSFLGYAFASGNTAPANTSLKVAFPTQNDGHEIIWVDSLQRSGANAFKGKLANAPNWLPGKKRGSPVRFTADQIRDWNLADPATGKLFGNYTTRVMLPHLPADQRQQIKSILTSKPLPKGW